MTPGGNYNETMDAYKKDTETMNNMFGSRLVVSAKQNLTY